MKRIQEKLNSTQGASILFAIMVFMLCILAGVSALTAAASNGGRFTHQESDQQQYLSVSSALGIFRDQFLNRSYTATINLVETYSWHYTETENADGTVDRTRHDSTAWSVGPLVSSGLIAGELPDTLLKDYLDKLFLNQEVPADWSTKDSTWSRPVTPVAPDRTFTVKANDADLANQLGDVTAEFSVNEKGYNVTVYLHTGSGSKLYESSLYMPASVTRSTSSSVVTSGDGDSGTKTTTTTLTFTVSWPESDISVIQGKIGGTAP